MRKDNGISANGHYYYYLFRLVLIAGQQSTVINTIGVKFMYSSTQAFGFPCSFCLFAYQKEHHNVYGAFCF